MVYDLPKFDTLILMIDTVDYLPDARTVPNTLLTLSYVILTTPLRYYVL